LGGKAHDRVIDLCLTFKATILMAAPHVPIYCETHDSDTHHSDSASHFRVPEASIPDLVRQKIRKILELYPVPDVEDVAFKQSIFEIFKDGTKPSLLLPVAWIANSS
jgi:hypothetical protein